MKNSSRDFSLDLLRALACIMVLGLHIGQRFMLPGAVGRFFEKGSTGVGFFFILSGYLGYCSLEKEFSRSRNRADAVKAFYIKRAVHVLPLYYLVIIFYFIFFTLLDRVPVDSSGLYWIRYIFFLNRWVPTSSDFWINLGATWSISVFVLFYILAPIIFMLVKRSFEAGIITIISYLALRLAENSATPIMYMFFFFLGILVYLSEKEGNIAWVISAECLLVLICILIGSGNSLIAPVIASMYLLASRGNRVVLNKNNFAYKVVAVISALSYSIYLIHILVFTVLDELWGTYDVGYLILFTAATILLTLLSYYLVEKKLSSKLLQLMLKK